MSEIYKTKDKKKKQPLKMSEIYKTKGKNKTENE